MTDKLNKTQLTSGGMTASAYSPNGRLIGEGTLSSPIAIDYLYKVEGKFYKVTTSGIEATSVVKGISLLSDAIDQDRDANTGATAATPKAISTVNKKVGDLTQLNTGSKGSLVEAINEVNEKVDPDGSGSKKPDLIILDKKPADLSELKENTIYAYPVTMGENDITKIKLFLEPYSGEVQDNEIIFTTLNKDLINGINDISR